MSISWARHYTRDLIFDSLWHFITKYDRCYYKMGQLFYYKMRQTFIFCYKMRQFYYIMRQLLQMAIIKDRYFRLQKATFITKFDVYYKLRQFRAYGWYPPPSTVVNNTGKAWEQQNTFMCLYIYYTLCICCLMYFKKNQVA